MAVSPGTYNFTLQRRADYVLQLQFKGFNAAPIDLTGWTVASQVWNEERTTKFSDFAVTYTSRIDGRVKLALNPTQTATFPDASFYDVLLTAPSGLREYYLEGVIYASQGFTV